MPTMKATGAEALANELQKLGENTSGVAKKCAYDGARAVTDAVAAAVKSLPLDENGFKPGTDPLRIITMQDRRDLEKCLGISRIENDGFSTTVSVSFDGYLSRKEDNFPKGVPAAMVARSIESGSSVRAKKPFMRVTLRKVTDTVLDVMKQTFDESVDQLKS